VSVAERSAVDAHHPRTTQLTTSASVRDTTDGVRTANRPATVWARRSTLLFLLLLVVAALLSLLGVHSSQSSTESDGYRLDVVYPRIARPGLDVPWQVTVSHPGGFVKGQLTLAVSGDYFNLYESQGFRPQPTEETRDGDTYYLTFTAPPGDVFRVYFDAYIQPASQAGRSGWVAVFDQGRIVARTDFATWLWP
jgi:hypothetical protein